MVNTKLGAIALVSILTLGAVGGAVLAAQGGESYLLVAVGGASAADLEARGLDVVDVYENFVTVRATPSEARSLRSGGLTVADVETWTGRGAFRLGDALPDGLEAAETERFVVQFRGPVKAEWRAALDEKAVAVYDYLPHHAFLARLDSRGVAAVAAMPEVAAVAPYAPAFKLAPELPAEGVADATVLAYPEEDLRGVLDALAAAGATPTAWASTDLEHVIDVTVPVESLADVARLEVVGWVEPAYDVGSHDNAQASAITQGGTTGAWPLHAKGVDGSTQILSVCDTGTNTNQAVPSVGATNSLALPRVIKMAHELHDDVTGTGLIAYNAHLADLPAEIPHAKIDLYYSPQENGNRGDWDDSNGHGTHTSGTIAGNSPLYTERNGNDGVAYAAKLQICDITIGNSFQILNSYANYWDPAYERGSRVNSNSWGSSHTNVYTEKARQHDAYTWEKRDFLVLRSMGNTGSTGSIRPEAVAKSAMGIGATQNGGGMENLAGFSTGGLTTDGRMKPNVVAPGDCLMSASTFGATGYTCLSGTSMSTPTVAGAAGLVRDYFAKGYYPTGEANSGDAMNVSSALVRAVLQVSGKEISGDRGQTAFPNKAQGWGRVLLEDALFFAGDARKSLVVDEGAGLATGASATHTVTVSAGQPLRIMVAWSDYPGAAGANPALVNDLDLVVTGPSGETYLGNAFVGNQVLPNQGSKDARNVEEAVYVNAPAAGTYTIKVSGASVPSGPQPYALVATGGLA